MVALTSWNTLFGLNVEKQLRQRPQTTQILQVAKLQTVDLTNNFQRFNAVKDKIVQFYQTSTTPPYAT